VPATLFLTVRPDAFPRNDHGPPTALFRRPNWKTEFEHAFELYFDLSNNHRTALRSIYEDAKVTEVFDALLNGLTVVGEREPLRVNAALERLLRHLLDESSSPAEIGFWEIEGYMSPSAHQVDGTAASVCFCARHFTRTLLTCAGCQQTQKASSTMV